MSQSTFVSLSTRPVSAQSAAANQRRLNSVFDEIRAANPLPPVDLFRGDSQVSTGYVCSVCTKGIAKVQWYQVRHSSTHHQLPARAN